MDQALPISETIPGVPPRRTFAIISHPDAGKTTLTEKLLLFGGAIREAGMVKARQDRRQTRSDWMKIERQRGISVTSSVMTFEFGGAVFNLLDTPGHEDFSEDTYRTLTAVDSAVMVIDAAKGIELQTKKLFEVCRLRNIPITTFINKVDREGQNPFELLDEIADTLALDICPMVWPIGMGGLFKGCYDLRNDKLVSARKPGEDAAAQDFAIPAEQKAQLDEDVELIRAAFPEFDQQSYAEGHLTPVYFGSALKDYSVRELLEGLVANAPPPQPRESDTRVVEPSETPVTGFVFKVQANMNKAHRDRVAFARIVSGHFTRGMDALHVRGKKEIKLNYPHMFFGRERLIVDEAYPGDILGLINPGLFRIGDVLSAAGPVEFDAVPRFSPEQFSSVRLADPGGRKGFLKGVQQIAEEGVVQVFWPRSGAPLPILGAVGRLQFEVLQHRLKNEYACPVIMEPRNFQMARWLQGGWPEPSRFWGELVEDSDRNPAILFENDWQRRTTMEKNPDLRFLDHPA